MKVLNLCKGLLALGTVAVALTSCNMDDRKDREDRTVEKQTEIKKVDRTGNDGVIREDRTRTDTTRRQAN